MNRPHLLLTDGGGRQDVTAADILHHLAQHPATYQQVLEGAQLGLAWSETPRRPIGAPASWVRLDARGGVRWVGQVFQEGTNRWGAFVHHQPIGRTHPTVEEARDAVDAELREQGWTLLGGGS